VGRTFTRFPASANFPTTPGAFQRAPGGEWDAFVSKLQRDGAALAYSTYLGGAADEEADGVAVDVARRAHVTGLSRSVEFPTTPDAFQLAPAGSWDVFVTTLNRPGRALVYSTYFGGSGTDIGAGIALDASGDIYVTGHTDSADLPTTAGAFDTTLDGSFDAFVVRLSLHPGGAGRALQVLSAPEDTFLNLDATNYSGAAMLATYTWRDYQVANAIVMKFDLSSIPAGAVVEEVTLDLALIESDAMPDSTYTVTAHKVVGKNPVIGAATGYTADGVTGWTANACCYNSVPLAQADISPAYDTRAIDKTPGVKSWTITAMVREWLAGPATNFGLLLNSDASTLRDRYRFFASAEHPDATLRPVLRVIYATENRRRRRSPRRPHAKYPVSQLR
jgi:hypothetical protein